MAQANDRDASAAILLMLKGFVSELPPEQQGKVAEAARSIRTLVESFGQEGQYALVMVSNELVAAGDLL